MSFFSTSNSASLSGPIVSAGTLGIFGDWVVPPPGRPTNVNEARYCTAPKRDDVDRHTADDVVDTEDHRGDGVDESAEHAHQDGAEDAGPGAVVVAEVAGAVGPEDHHSLEADVDDARTLGPQSAEPGEHDRHGRDQGGGHGAGRRQVAGTRDRPRAPRASGSPRARRRANQNRGSRRRCAGAAGSRRRWGCGDTHAVTSSRSLLERSGDRLLLQSDAVAPHELVGDDHGQHDHALGDRHDVRRDADQDLQRVGLLVEVGEQQGADGDPDRVVAAEQGDRDAGEAETGLEGRAVGVATSPAGSAGPPGPRRRPRASWRRSSSS